MKYEIQGEPMPVVLCDLEGGESMITEKGSMVWMSPNMEMETSRIVAMSFCEPRS